MEPIPHPKPGDIVAGKYRVERILGQGGMGVVLAAKHTVLDQRFALKFVLDLSDAEATERFLREARATAKLETEHVCRVSDVGTHEGAPFIVMEMLSGMDLHGRLTAFGPMVPTEAVDYLLQALDALSEAHARGIVHRDLKPSNIFLATRGDGSTIVKVLDFGISKMHEGTGHEALTASTRKKGESGPALPASLTQTGTVMGSPPYMSPEQLVSTRDVDARCDLWAMGAILYELLTGQRAFQGSNDLFTRILAGEYIPLRVARPDLPEGLDAVIEKCLAVDREQRWATAAELSRALLLYAPSKGKLHAARAERWAAGASKAPPAMTPRAAPVSAPAAPTGGVAFATTKRMLVKTATSKWSLVATLVLGTIAIGLFVVAARIRSNHLPAAASAVSDVPPPIVAVDAPVPAASEPPPPEPAVMEPGPSASTAATSKDAGAPHAKKPTVRHGKPTKGDGVDLGRL